MFPGCNKIMMAEVDGCETVCELRKRREFHPTAVFALTDKGMKGDHEKCLQALGLCRQAGQ
jgi:CheY-like chemotaxis protein